MLINSKVGGTRCMIKNLTLQRFGDISNNFDCHGYIYKTLIFTSTSSLLYLSTNLAMLCKHWHSYRVVLHKAIYFTDCRAQPMKYLVWGCDFKIPGMLAIMWQLLMCHPPLAVLCKVNKLTPLLLWSNKILVQEPTGPHAWDYMSLCWSWNFQSIKPIFLWKIGPTFYAISGGIKIINSWHYKRTSLVPSPLPDFI